VSDFFQLSPLKLWKSLSFVTNITKNYEFVNFCEENVLWPSEVVKSLQNIINFRKMAGTNNRGPESFPRGLNEEMMWGDWVEAGYIDEEGRPLGLSECTDDPTSVQAAARDAVRADFVEQATA
jgi:hypothetical protein